MYAKIRNKRPKSNLSLEAEKMRKSLKINRDLQKKQSEMIEESELRMHKLNYFEILT